MSNKRYYWLKLKEDFFEEDTISWIEDQPNGKEYSLFYLKLCLKSLKTDGILIRNVGEMLIPYDTKTLSKITNTDIDTVMVAMELFKRIGLIQIFDNGEIFLTQLKNMVGSETDKAELMRKKRAKDKLIESKHNVNGNNVTKALPNCYTEKEKEKEKELELELDREKATAKKRFTPPTTKEVSEYCIERGNNIDPEQFVAFYESKGWKVGNNHMKDWKSAIITWEKREKNPKKKSKQEPQSYSIEDFASYNIFESMEE